MSSFVEELTYQAEQFRTAAERVWSEATAYPGSFNPDVPSAGQCGVSSYALGLFLRDTVGLPGVAFSYERGKLEDNDQIVGPNHSWLRVYDGAGSIGYAADITGDQYGLPGKTVIAAGSQNGTRLYAAEKSTPLAMYDTSKFAGRLAIFLEGLEAQMPSFTNSA